MGKLKLFGKLLATQIKTKFKKAEEYSVPRCGVSFTKMKKLAEEAQGIKVVEGQDTKATTFRVTSKAPEMVFGFVSQVGEHIMSTIDNPNKKDQKRLQELGLYIKELEPKMKNLDMYREASTLLK